MKKERTTLLLLIMILFLIIPPGRTLAEERSIYVGDLIELRISTQEFTRDELEEKFKDFEIVSIEEDGGDYLVTLRSFEIGEKKILLGDKEILVNIRSTLDEIKRDDAFEGDLSPEKAGFYIDWQYVFYLLLFIVLLTGGLSLYRYLKNRKKSLQELTPRQRFNRQTEGISTDDGLYFVKLTFYFKEFLEAVYSCRIRGKTSTELLESISRMPELQESLSDIRSWLYESDCFKFSGISVSREKKQLLLDSLVELVRKIDRLKGGEAC